MTFVFPNTNFFSSPLICLDIKRGLYYATPETRHNFKSELGLLGYQPWWREGLYSQQYASTAGSQVLPCHLSRQENVSSKILHQLIQDDNWSQSVIEACLPSEESLYTLIDQWKQMFFIVFVCLASKEDLALNRRPYFFIYTVGSCIPHALPSLNLLDLGPRLNN